MEIESPEASTRLLMKKYDLHKAPEVTAAANRHAARTGEGVPQNPLDRIQNYLNRFHEIIDREDPQQRERGMEAIKRLLHGRYVVKPDEIPESYWETQRRILRERGQGADLEHVDWEELKRQNVESIVADQTTSMDKWIDYLSSSDAPYPDALKYWTLRNVLSMGEYDKGKKQYPQRSKGTTKPFPDLNREALAYVIDAVDKKYTVTGEQRALEDTDPEFEKLLQEKKFAKLYAFAIEKVTPVYEQGLVNTTGQWVKFDQGSDHMPLVTSLQGYGTGWCTAGESTAQAQLQGGDFYVYYSDDRDGKPTVPRVAIRMEGNSIAEVRGIVGTDQNLDGGMTDIVEEKLKEFPDGKAYQKKVVDMKLLTQIDHKMQEGTPLNASDLVFLYEVDRQIQGFGYSRDPRIEEIQNQRNPEEDMPVVFSCEPSQIAHNLGELRSDTKAYIGPLVPGIFGRLQEYNIEHVYMSFPEKKIRRQQVQIGGKTKEQLQAELTDSGIEVSSYAQDLINNPRFTPGKVAEMIWVVVLKIEDLVGFSGFESTNRIYSKAKELGLELCPAEVGPHMILQSNGEPPQDSYCIGMKQITDRDGDPDVFSLGWYQSMRWLGEQGARSGDGWGSDIRIAFSLRKSPISSQ